VPETVNEFPPECVAEAVNEVETGFDSDPVLRLKVIVPGPTKLTSVGSFEPEQAKSPEQLQLENVNPIGT